MAQESGLSRGGNGGRKSRPDIRKESGASNRGRTLNTGCSSRVLAALCRPALTPTPLLPGLGRDPGLHAGFVPRPPQLGLQQRGVLRLLWDWPSPAAAADSGHGVHRGLGGVVPAGGLPARAGLRHLPAAGAGRRGARWPWPGSLVVRVCARAWWRPPGRGRGPESSWRGRLQLRRGRADSTWRCLWPGGLEGKSRGSHGVEMRPWSCGQDVGWMHALWLQLTCEISTKEGSKAGPLTVRTGPGAQGAARTVPAGP